MSVVLNSIGAILFLIWIIAYFGYNAGDNLHLLLVLAIIPFLLKTLMHLPAKDKSFPFENKND